MKTERDFKGIWIPREIWLSKYLTLQEKVFLVEIDSLDNKDGCFASNAYFADFFGLSIRRARVIISSLVKKGRMTSTIVYKNGGKEVDKRVLRVIPSPQEEKFPTLGKKASPPPGNNVPHPREEKCQDNNTINNTVNNTTNKRVKKSVHLEFVLLTDEENAKLLDKLGKDKTDDYIERLNNYIGSTGKKYKSHYHTILSWSRKDDGNHEQHKGYNNTGKSKRESQSGTNTDIGEDLTDKATNLMLEIGSKLDPRELEQELEACPY